MTHKFSPENCEGNTCQNLKLGQTASAIYIKPQPTLAFMVHLKNAIGPETVKLYNCVYCNGWNAFVHDRRTCLIITAVRKTTKYDEVFSMSLLS